MAGQSPMASFVKDWIIRFSVQEENQEYFVELFLY